MKTLFFHESFQIFLIILMIGCTLVMFFPEKGIGIIIAVGVVILFMCYFYRIPERHMHRTCDLLAVSDGQVVEIVYNPHKHTYRVAVFLNIMDQHQQYYPADGKVIRVIYKKGSFHPAYLMEKSKYNERMDTVLRLSQGSILTITQIAGQVAKRVVNYAQIGESVSQGGWLGMIKLSSRVDVEFSSDHYKPAVSVGHKIFAKQTILAYRKGK